MTLPPWLAGVGHDDERKLRAQDLKKGWELQSHESKGQGSNIKGNTNAKDAEAHETKVNL